MFKKIIISLISVVLVIFANSPSENQSLSIPKVINFQGKLTNINGSVVADSTYTITFRLFPTLTGGSAFWSETQSVQTNNGIFNCLLGSVIPISNIPTDGNCYLEMQINPLPAITPRIRIVSSAYAFYSQKSDSANYALNATITRPISPPITTDEINNNAINSLKILDGTISREDVASNFKAPFADTADFARSVSVLYVDSARIAVNAYKLQGKDTTDLSAKFVDEGQVNAITNLMITDNAITSAKIQDNSITRSDVVVNFKAPFADTADFARSVNVLYVDSARIAVSAYNANKLQGKDTADLDLRYINEGQTNAISTAMIIDNAVNNQKLANDAVTSDKILDGTIGSNDIRTPLTLSNNIAYPQGVLNIKNTGSGRGISIDTAGFGGLAVNYSLTDGVNLGFVLQAGVYVDTAGGDGVFISNAGIDGIGINNAGWDGVYILNAGINGVEITEAANDGIYVMNAGNNGVTVNNAESCGVLAYGKTAGGEFVAANQSATGLVVHSYQNAVNDTAIQVYGVGFATGGWYTAGLINDKSAPCLISSERAIVVSGSATLTNRKATINFDPLFTENVNLDFPIRITVTPKAKPAGFIYVAETKATGFTVELEPIPGLEKNQTDIAFDWIAFGTLKNQETSASAQAQWQKMMQAQQEKQTEAKLRNQKREHLRQRSQKLPRN